MYFRRVFPLLGLAAGVHGLNAFRRPPGPGEDGDYRDNPTYELGEKLDIQWEVDFDQVTVLIQQQDIDDSLRDQFTAEVVVNTTKSRYTWDVSFDDFSSTFDDTASNVFFFRLLDDSGAEDEITSHYFNVTSAAESTTTSEAPTATSTEAAAATTSAADTGLSRTGLVGVSIGATIGGMVLLGSLFGFIMWKLLRRRGYGPPPPHPQHHHVEQPLSPRQTKPDLAMSPSSMTTSTMVPPPLPTQHYYHELHQQHYQPSHELSHERIHEAPS
ncbi:hypothetical protein AK830_g8685 [Neonectria ditissima]|uniref:Mid2 domain-containing protein n=1 Tax=Neonectria ditissima TaxID=78410 RepID=A0A0P7BAT6_9HYPO|nr:hypothetical protein AK830_g8685 [Neonectria ditissima]